jgi:riboflavin kinase/FMN adenylyltransferase
VRRLRGPEDLPGDWQQCVATIGVFDGVHRGHQKVITRAVEMAADRGAPAIVLSFDPHPAEVLHPGTHPGLLTTADRKAELFGALGVDVSCVLRFTTELARLSPEAFARQILLERLHAGAVVVGADFTLGFQARGSATPLPEIGARCGFAVVTEELLCTAEPQAEPVVVSSTHIRSRIGGGEVAAAAAALGRPHRVAGVVVHGDGRGAELGFPTANVSPVPLAAVPADGVYACWLGRDRRAPARAAVSIGTNPTFAGRERRVEAYLLDENPDLYGAAVDLDFVTRIRGMTRFDSAGELIGRMNADVAETAAVLGVA